jgi:hypothetical protein
MILLMMASQGSKLELTANFGQEASCPAVGRHWHDRDACRDISTLMRGHE